MLYKVNYYFDKHGTELAKSVVLDCSSKEEARVQADKYSKANFYYFNLTEWDKLSKKIYLACSFAYKDKIKTEERKSIMEEVEKELTSRGYQVYNPSKLKIKDAWSYSMYDWGQLVFDEDVRALDESDAVVFVSFGKENNSGSVWEVGYSYALKKPILVVSMTNEPESLMIIHSARSCVKGIDGLKTYDLDIMPENRIDVVES